MSTETPTTIKITEEDLNLIRYFWEEKGDLTRWHAWEEKSASLWKEYPVLMSAWEQYIRAYTVLNAVVKDL